MGGCVLKGLGGVGGKMGDQDLGILIGRGRASTREG